MTTFARSRDLPALGTAAAPRRRRRRGSKPLVARALVVGLLLLALAVGPLVSPYNPIQPSLAETFAGPSPSHPLGTDNFGRDILTRLLYGGRVDLLIGFLATIVTFAVGALLGALAGYYG